MGEDQPNPDTPDFTTNIGVADLPDDITTIYDTSQEYCSDAEKQQAEALTTIHVANLSTISSRISWIDDQIAQLQAQRRKLPSKQNQESRNVAILKSILGPIRRVPTDLLCEIFVRCLPKTSTCLPINKLKSSEAPLLLCLVCSKWRRTAFALPLLWKALAFRESIMDDDSQTPPIITVHPSVSSILNSWFSRAGGCPLSLKLDLKTFLVEESLTLKLEDALNRLPNSRLQHLSLSAPYPSDTYFISKVPQEFTQLESIFLQAVNGLDWASHAPGRLLQSAPRLYSSELQSFLAPDVFPESLIPWSQLTHLRVEGNLGAKMWYTVIRHCPNLQHGIFSFDENDSLNTPMIPTSDHDIVLPYLVDLTIYVTKHGKKPAFGWLVFPTLRRLQLLFEIFMSMRFIHLWNDFFPAVGTSSLNNLVIIGVLDFSQPQLQSLFNSSSAVTKLHLSLETSYTGFFNALTASSHGQLLLPNLEDLHCDIEDEDEDGIMQSIISFVRSRCSDPWNSTSTHTTAQLRRLTLKFYAGLYAKDFIDHANQLLAPFLGQDLSLVLDTWGHHTLNLREMMCFASE